VQQPVEAVLLHVQQLMEIMPLQQVIILAMVLVVRVLRELYLPVPVWEEQEVWVENLTDLFLQVIVLPCCPLLAVFRVAVVVAAPMDVIQMGQQVAMVR
jgi:hypothetical protein